MKIEDVINSKKKWFAHFLKFNDKKQSNYLNICIIAFAVNHTIRI